MSKRNKYLALLLGAGITAFGAGIFIAKNASALTTVMSDDFSSYSNNQTITSDATYNSAAFPGEGTGNCCGNPSSKWEMDNGQLIGETDSGSHKWGHIEDNVSSQIYRLNTQASSTDTVVSWIGKSSQVGTAADQWMRFQSQYWLYAVQYDRGDGCIVAKRKVPTNTAASGQWLGPGTDIANDGVYYVLKLDADSPPITTGPCNQDGILWTDEGTTSAIDDATLNSGHQYTYKVTITTLHKADAKCGMSFDCVQLQLFRGGTLVASWTDKNDGLSPDGTRTTQQDCNNNYFNNVTGYTTAWCFPIYAAGKSGFRNDDPMDTWINSFVLADASSTSPPPPTSNFQQSTSSTYIHNDTLQVKQGTVRIQQ